VQVTKVNRNYLGRSQINEKWPPIQLLIYEVNVVSSYPFQIYGHYQPFRGTCQIQPD
jgi:hypothetical protein